MGWRRGDDRIFHPDENGADRPISALWNAPPAYVKNILSCIRLLESAVVQRAVERVQAGGRFCSTDGDFERSCPPGGGFDGGGFVRSALVMKENTRVAFFPCVYHEVDGVAKIGREFEAFASRHEIQFFTVHAGRRDLVTTAGPVTRVQRPRSLAEISAGPGSRLRPALREALSKAGAAAAKFPAGCGANHGAERCGHAGCVRRLQDGNPARGF